MDILKELAGGNRRTLGRANEIVEKILKNPELFATVFDGMVSKDPVVRMRAADVVEKVSASRPDLLQPFAERLLGPVAQSDQPDVQRHVAQMLPRLNLTEAQRRQAESLLVAYLGARGSIVKASALSALAEFAARDSAMRARVAPLLGEAARTGTAAVRARGRRLLARLGQASDTKQ